MGASLCTTPVQRGTESQDFGGERSLDICYAQRIYPHGMYYTTPWINNLRKLDKTWKPHDLLSLFNWRVIEHDTSNSASWEYGLFRAKGHWEPGKDLKTGTSFSFIREISNKRFSLSHARKTLNNFYQWKRYWLKCA